MVYPDYTMNVVLLINSCSRNLHPFLFKFYHERHECLLFHGCLIHNQKTRAIRDPAASVRNLPVNYNSGKLP